MGTWGPGIFDDDFAADVRAAFRRLIGDGLTAEAATAQMVGTYAQELADEDEAALFWIALAVTQWKVGRLTDDVRARATSAIARGPDSRWDDPSDADGRRGALERAGEQLQRPQRSPVTIRKTILASTPFEPGDVVVYRHPSGHDFVFWVKQNVTDDGGVGSIIELLDVPPIVGLDRVADAEPLYRAATGRADRLVPAAYWLAHAERLRATSWRVLGNVEWPASRRIVGALVASVERGRGEPKPWSLDAQLQAFL